MNKLLFLILLALSGFLSCYDDLIDTYDDAVVYKLRDRGPAGGWIFYINPNWEKDGWRYLEAAPEDQNGGSALIWSLIGFANGGNSSLPPMLTGIGDGKKNTDWIKDNKNPDDYPAFKACINYSYGGYSDWFLPSKDELSEMCWNLKGVDWDSLNFQTLNNPDVSVPLGDFKDNNYWSSSESGVNAVHVKDFASGVPTTAGKNIPNVFVRAIREF